ncbi:Gfo/Idh/MocA family protein [Prochlorococcus marinus]|uniref:Oxidoreductase n=1 Tax=Prochlorococcus marinus (strain MIT 9303) TaxID=59922 RepID=A2C5W1_PROM3|nr:Gfo/Idh/MocA family oxidoreductase [Prochlorococcus marinus]ABM76871.1 Hypothetical protein P9303_01161 [Prochlorococcus marinus str. MIT 9303]
MKSKRVVARVLVCGLGSIGKQHIKVIKKYWPSIEIAILRSSEKRVNDEFSNGLLSFGKIDEAAKWKPNAAIISSPSILHVKQAIYLSKHEIPVLIEKPLSDGNESREEIEELISLSKTIPILVGYLLRFDPCAEYLKEIIEKENLGKILEVDFYCGSWLPDWRTADGYEKSVSARRDLGGGVLLELSHEIDLAIWLLKLIDLEKSILKNSGLLNVDVEDYAFLLFKSHKEAVVSLRLNFCTQSLKRSVTIQGEKGMVQWDILKGKILVESRHGTRDLMTIGVKHDERLRRQFQNFIDCIDGESSPICTVEDGVEVLKVIKEAKLMASIYGEI